MGNEVEAVHTPGAWHTVSENTPEKTPYVHGCILYLFNIHGNFIQPDPVLKKPKVLYRDERHDSTRSLRPLLLPQLCRWSLSFLIVALLAMLFKLLRFEEQPFLMPARVWARSSARPWMQSVCLCVENSQLTKPKMAIRKWSVKWLDNARLWDSSLKFI